jgi:tetratricopeptide (TPR) repeat protein
MLLRQLYLSHYEQRRFDDALAIARQMLALRVLPDVCHHDIARAMAALGQIDAAVGELRLAARTAPARRRAFHLWTLGSVLFLNGRHELAEAVMQRALRWSTTERPLYAGHLALIRIARDQPPGDLVELIEQLAAAPCGQGYGRLVLGLLCERAGRAAEARSYLRTFLDRSRQGRPALALALAGEVELAEEHLRRLGAN